MELKENSIYFKQQLLLSVGGVVVVPFNSYTTAAVVMEISATHDLPEKVKIKSIRSISSPDCFSKQQLEMLCKAAKYYVTPLGNVFSAAVPNFLKNQLDNKQQLVKRFQELTPLGYYFLLELQQKNKYQQYLKAALDYANSIYNWYQHLDSPKLVHQAQQLIADNPKEINQNLIKSLANLLSLGEQRHSYKSATQSFKKLLQLGLISSEQTMGGTLSLMRQLALDLPDWQNIIPPNFVNVENRHQLNSQQQQCFDQIQQGKGFRIELIDGITGSGKTEIYLQLIEETLKQGKGVLLLVPEINLTPQMIERFQARFEIEIAMLHSAVNDRQRYQIYLKAKYGKIPMVIGTRSASFVAFKDLGLIIMDEEHDSSYKQISVFNYHARDYAIARARELDIPVILGTATPSIVSYRNCFVSDFYKLHKISKRAATNLQSEMVVINMLGQKIKSGISKQLMQLIHEHTAKGNQVMLFINRRGYATQVVCDNCGYIYSCSGCHKPYTLHKNFNRLSCHHCNFNRPMVDCCPNCKSDNISHLGLGTQQIEQLMHQYYQPQEVLRIDRDSVTSVTKLDEKLEAIHSGQAKVIIGTQMLAKGHHFPNLTLVALLDIDSYLIDPTRSSLEQAAQLFMQVAGRAGRENKQGTIVLQTRMLNDFYMQRLIENDYHSFIELAHNLDPVWKYYGLVKFKLDNQQLIKEFLHKVYNILINLAQQLELTLNDNWIRVVDAGMQNFNWNYQICVALESRSQLNQLLQALSQEIQDNKKEYKRVDISFDVDPIDI